MSPQPEQSTQEVLAGLVERVTYHNAENGFCVLRARARGHRDIVTVVGHAATIAAGNLAGCYRRVDSLRKCKDSSQCYQHRCQQFAVPASRPPYDEDEYRKRSLQKYAPVACDDCHFHVSARDRAGRHPRLHDVARQYNPRLRSGSATSLGYLGIVSFPSFHTAMAILFAVAHRDIWWSFPIFLILNVLMLITIPYSGNHYLIDVIGGAVIAACAFIGTLAVLAGLCLAASRKAVSSR